MKVASFAGSVSVDTGGGAKSAAAGDILKPGDLIVTGEASSADILVEESGLVRIGPKTTVKIESIFQKEKGETRLALSAGRIFVSLSKIGKNTFSVKTPTVAASIKGTIFRITHEENLTRVDVLDGEVTVTPIHDGKALTGREIIVATDQSVAVDSSAIDGMLAGKKEIVPNLVKDEDVIEISAENGDIDPMTLEKVEKSSSKKMKSIFKKTKKVREKKKKQVTVRGGSTYYYSGGGGYYSGGGGYVQQSGSRRGGGSLFTSCSGSRKK